MKRTVHIGYRSKVNRTAHTSSLLTKIIWTIRVYNVWNKANIWTVRTQFPSWGIQVTQPPSHGTSGAYLTISATREGSVRIRHRRSRVLRHRFPLDALQRAVPPDDPSVQQHFVGAVQVRKAWPQPQPRCKKSQQVKSSQVRPAVRN